MSKAHDSHGCTYPSGDSSLRWPCPAHPPEAQEAPEAVAIREAVTLLINEAARLERVYGIKGWYGFSDEKAAHIEHLRVAEALAALPAPQAQLADALEHIRQAVRDYQYALDTRQHGGVAADKAISSIERALCTPWKQGAESARRSTIPAISQQEQDE